MSTCLRRREFIAGLGGAAAWPLAARAQQAVMPVVGFLSNGSREGFSPYLATFRQGPGEAGFVEGRNVAIALRRSLEPRIAAVSPLAKVALRARH